MREMQKTVQQVIILTSILKRRHNKYIIFGFLYKRNDKDQHFDEFHVPIECECGEKIEKMFLEDHKVSRINF
jgi:hypothetical protein